MQPDIYFIGIPEGEKKEKFVKKLLNLIVIENFLGFETDTHPDTKNPKDSKYLKSRKIFSKAYFKLPKVKDK